MDDGLLIGKEDLGSTRIRAREVRAEVLTGPERRRCWSVEEKLRILAQSVAPGRSRRSNWRCSSSLPRSAIDEICLVPEGGQLRVELRGELTGILALAADSRKPGGLSATGLAQQIKLVAGTRYHLYRTALLWHLGRPRRTPM